LRKHEQALKVSDRAIELDPAYASVWTNRSSVQMALGRQEEALESANRAIELDSNYYLAWNNKAAALNNLHDHRDSLPKRQSN
jgi:tetratricopeptide (TPR) repeat protein